MHYIHDDDSLPSPRRRARATLGPACGVLVHILSADSSVPAPSSISLGCGGGLRALGLVYVVLNKKK